MSELAVANTKKELVVVGDDGKSFFAPGSKIKQKILEEEEYLTVLNKIVERDFYPELSKMKLQAEYLDALDSNDVEKLRQIQMQLEKSTPLRNGLLRDTPQNFDVAEPEPSNETSKTEPAASAVNKLTLDGFLSKNTSEDNASFEKIMEATREKHREKHAWLHQQQKELHERLDASKALPSSIEEQLLAIETKSNNLDTWKYEAKNALMYVPEGVELSAEQIIQSKGKKEKQICHENTRFKSDPFNSNASQTAMAKASQEQADLKKAVGKIGVDGKLEDGNQTPNVQGYSFVGAPSPAPGVEASPLMTWGEIEGTPLRLDATPAPSFKIPEVPRREKLARSLVEKASQQHRDKRKKAMAKAAHASIISPRNTPRDLLTSERLSRLSPAAQKLVKSNIRLNSDSSLRASYSPSPHHAKRTPSTPGGLVKTPSSRTKTPGSVRNDASSITDNLLQLPNT